MRTADLRTADLRTADLRTADLATRGCIEQTAFARLEAEGRLLSPVLKAPTHAPGRFGFRGEIALKFAPKIADEARPPELKLDQVMATAEEGSLTLPFLTAYLLSFEYIKPLAEALGDLAGPDGRYFLFCNNIDPLERYRVPFGNVTFFVLPIDEAAVYNELLDLLGLERNALKKLDTAGKLDRIADAAAAFAAGYPLLGYEEGLAIMGPVRNPNENRPV
jgi:hypothetical protein